MTSAKEKLIQELDQTPDFVIQEVLDFLLFVKLRLQDEIENHQSTDPQSVPSLPPFLQFVEEISTQIPREEWEKLPRDLSRNLDHYLYDAPKDGE